MTAAELREEVARTIATANWLSLPGASSQLINSMIKRDSETIAALRAADAAIAEVVKRAAEAIEQYRSVSPDADPTTIYLSISEAKHAVRALASPRPEETTHGR